MNAIANFYTIFWMIYFPTCIAYNDLPGFGHVDEYMTVILMVFTLIAQGWKGINRRPWKEFLFFLGVLAFYIIYSLIMAVNVSEAVWYDCIQQIRPYSILYCTWILNPNFSKLQKKLMVGVMLITFFAFIFFNPIVGEERNAPLGQLAMCTAMTYYLFTDQTKDNLWISAVIAIIGLLSMKFKYYGEFGAWMFMLFYMKAKFHPRKSGFLFKIALLGFIVLMLGWDRFDAYYVSGIDDEELARPMMYKASWQILLDYIPFGSGLGTFGTAAAAVYYTPLMYEYDLNGIWGLDGAGGFMCDAFYVTFAQIGFAGIIIFCMFWIKRLKQFYQIIDMRYYKVAMMCFFCLAIESTADSSYLSGKSMGFFMLIAICLNANRLRFKG